MKDRLCSPMSRLYPLRIDSFFERTELSREANRESQKLFPIFKMGCVQNNMNMYEKTRKQALHKKIGLVLIHVISVQYLSILFIFV